MRVHILSGLKSMGDFAGERKIIILAKQPANSIPIILPKKRGAFGERLLFLSKVRGAPGAKKHVSGCRDRLITMLAPTGNGRTEKGAFHTATRLSKYSTDFLLAQKIFRGKECKVGMRLRSA